MLLRNEKFQNLIHLIIKTFKNIIIRFALGKERTVFNFWLNTQ
jgi:hypothetical protein